MVTKFIVATCLSVQLMANAALGATPLERVMAQLTAQGFEVVEMERTWLGRIKLEATNGSIRREIVFDRTSGEILRDIWKESDRDNNENDDEDDDDDDDD